MELYKEILVAVLSKETTRVEFPYLSTSAKEIVNCECYQVLQKIKTIIEDDSLDDKECFLKIEKIINLFEDLGSDCGNRHDFS